MEEPHSMRPLQCSYAISVIGKEGIQPKPKDLVAPFSNVLDRHPDRGAQKATSGGIRVGGVTACSTAIE
jgi:hypothetical protein